MTRPLEEQGEKESQKLWHSTNVAIKHTDHVAATDEKTKIEEAQREEAARRQQEGHEWTPLLFRPVEGGPGGPEEGEEGLDWILNADMYVIRIMATMLQLTYKQKWQHPTRKGATDFGNSADTAWPEGVVNYQDPAGKQTSTERERCSCAKAFDRRSDRLWLCTRHSKGAAHTERGQHEHQPELVGRAGPAADAAKGASSTEGHGNRVGGRIRRCQLVSRGLLAPRGCICDSTHRARMLLLSLGMPTRRNRSIEQPRPLQRCTGNKNLACGAAEPSGRYRVDTHRTHESRQVSSVAIPTAVLRLTGTSPLVTRETKAGSGS